jgi:hypothetical protein
MRCPSTVVLHAGRRVDREPGDGSSRLQLARLPSFALVFRRTGAAAVAELGS